MHYTVVTYYGENMTHYKAYYKVRNDISVATLSRIVSELGKLELFTPTVQIRDVLDVRVRLVHATPDHYDTILKELQVENMPTGALKVIQEECR